MAGIKTGVDGQINNNIQTIGLVAYYDAAYNKSFTPGTTKTYNLASGSLTPTGSLINDSVWSSDNQGIWVFDGVADYIDCETSLADFFGDNYAGDLTVIMWLKSDVTGTIDDGFFSMGTTFDNASAKVILRQKNDEWYWILGGTWTKKCTQPSTANFYQIAGTYKAGSASDCKFYLDAVEQNAGSGAGGFPGASDMDFAGLKTIIGGYYSTSYCINGDISNVLIYNRHLSDADVLQNYNAQKDRFGL